MEKSARFWNKNATHFEKNDNPNSAVRRATYDKIRKHLSPNSEVLDIGCATGSLCIALSDNVKSIHGIDIAEKMISIGQQKIKERHLHNVRLTKGSIMDAQFDDQQYDVILAFYILHLVAKLETSLRRLRNMLTPGGTLIIEVPCLKEQKGFKPWFIRTFSKFLGVPYLQHYHFSSMADMLKDIGCNIVDNQYIKSPTARNYIVTRNENR